MLDSLKVGHRLLAGFALMLLLMLGAVGMAFWKMAAMAADTTRIVTVYNVEQGYSNRMMSDLQRVQRYLRTMLISKDPAELKANSDKSSAARRGFRGPWGSSGSDPFRD